ncbi:phage tail tape measure protein [Cupriavidus sp. YAF13]|uniref:phage tail tape measure protein n=1 Tax=Cupriavidus sp. YAF13 TaxID=3233075 RepID=UPI003F91402E
MANDTVVRVTADASGYSAEMDKARRSAATFIEAQEAAARRTQAAQAAITEAAKNGADASARQIAAFVSQASRMAETVGKTRAQLLEQKAAQLGVTDSVSAYIEKLKAAEAAAGGMHKISDAMNATGISAKQTAAAMRMVPAQMTDIVTQLQGGANPMTVLIQQGGQLKDMFGGIGPAMRAMGTYLASLVNPFSLAAVAAASLGFVMSRGAGESRAYSEALVMTGGHAGKTSDQLATMAASMSRSIGTQSQAAETLVKLAETGKVAGEQMQSIGMAAQAMHKATGAAVDDTVAKFVQLADEPVKASVKLNEQYHYLTHAVYEQIAALEEEGKKEQATAVAQQALADKMKERADKVIANLGYMERAWNAVKGAATSAWDAMLGLGRAATLDEIRSKITATQNQIASIEGDGGFANNGNGAAFGAGARGRAAQLSRLRDELQQLQAQAKPLEDASNQQQVAADAQKRQDAMVSAQVRLDAQKQATRSRAAQRKDEIDQLKRDAETVGMAADEYNRRVAAINDKYKDPKGPKAKAYQDDAATKFLQQLRDQEAADRAALASNDKLTQAQKQQAEFLQKIADLKGKSILTAEQQSLLANQDAIKAQLKQNVETEKALKLKEEIAKVEERSRQISEHMKDIQTNHRDNYGRELDAFGKGADAQKQAEAVKTLTKEYERMQWQLEKATKPEARNSDAYLQGQADIKAGLQQSLQDYSDYYAELKAKQADWTNGATSAIANYVDSARNMAAQTANVVTSMAQGMENALANFVTTGKLNFKSLADSMIAEIARIQMKQAVAGLVGMLGSAFGAGAGSATNFNGSIQGVSGAFGGAQTTGVFLAGGGAVSGPGTSTSDSIAAWLSDGEFVVNADATAKYRGLLEAINGGRGVGSASRYATGGYVGDAAPSPFVPTSSGNALSNQVLSGGDINVNVSLVEDSAKAGQVQQQRNGKGLDLMVFVDSIKKAIAGDIISGGNQISTAMERGYGLNRVGRR